MAGNKTGKKNDISSFIFPVDAEEISFIHPSNLDDDEIITAIGGKPSVQNLVNAYKIGIFPFPQENDAQIPWVSFQPRGVLFADELHIPKSLARQMRKSQWSFTINQAFEKVIHHCATVPRSLYVEVGDDWDGEEDQNNDSTESSNNTSISTAPSQTSWITPDIIHGYTKLFHAGHVLSFEVWNPSQQLVGGLYGVWVDGHFSGESMFHIESGASKAALAFCVQSLSEKGVNGIRTNWIDTQMTTPPVRLLGGREIPRSEFLKLIK